MRQEEVRRHHRRDRCSSLPLLTLVRWWAVKLVTGSLQGVLRIYQATQKDFKLEDLLIESDVGHPILQLQAGRFSAYVAISTPCIWTAPSRANVPAGAAACSSLCCIPGSWPFSRS
jgi:hypothetical protein